MDGSGVELEHLWPDPDRRHDALLRVERRIESQPDDRSTLTAPEAQVIEALSYGLRRSEIADVLGISLETVKERRRRAMRVLRAKTTPHAVALALRQGMIR